jgi:hypothetical protein
MNPQPAEVDAETDWVEPEVRKRVVTSGLFSLADLVNSETFPRYLLFGYLAVCGVLLIGVILSFALGDTQRYREDAKLAHDRDAAVVELPKRIGEDEKSLRDLAARVHQLEHRRSGITTPPPAATSRDRTTLLPKAR